MAASPAIVEAAEDAGLHYVSDSMPGITRHRAGNSFSYRNPDGSPVADPHEIDRINKLAIPPAYEHVWICPDSNGHLQATGIDARGRKQYRYHHRFREVQDEHKFKRMLAFGQRLAAMRERVDANLAERKLSKQKVLAAVVYLLEKSLIRVGNEEYAKENKSFGLTTLRNRHVKIEGSRIEFNFLGKSKIQHRIEIQDRRLARVIRKLQDLPGQELFQYVDDDGQICSVTSADVNAYLQEISGERFTAKDFRTWWGTLLALIELGNQDPPTTKMGSKRAITRVMSTVSKQLGNTAAICRKCYVHPVVIKAFEEGALAALLQGSPETVEDLVVCAETALLDLLRKQESEDKLAA
jgi:DNA topoisomerase-1